MRSSYYIQIMNPCIKLLKTEILVNLTFSTSKEVVCLIDMVHSLMGMLIFVDDTEI